MPIGTPRPLCWWCKHFDVEYQLEASIFRCSAFPYEIPDEIAGDEYGYTFDHRRPHPDDGGIQFEKLNDFDALKQRLSFRKCQSMEVINASLSRTLRYLDQINALQASFNQDDTDAHSSKIDGE